LQPSSNGWLKRLIDVICRDAICFGIGYAGFGEAAAASSATGGRGRSTFVTE
jgi:hypothetical protein